jgi:hypothetical protein
MIPWLTALLCIGASAFALPAAAQAEGARDFCKDVLLEPGTTCAPEGSAESSFIETEGWNTSGEGVGSCTGVVNEGWVAEVCVGDVSSGYDEVYCTSGCNGAPGWAAVHDHSAYYRSYFTAWGRYR